MQNTQLYKVTQLVQAWATFWGIGVHYALLYYTEAVENVLGCNKGMLACEAHLAVHEMWTDWLEWHRKYPSYGYWVKIVD